MRKDIQILRILGTALLGLSLTACAASLENEILDEAEQAELSDASDVSQPNDSDASDGEQPVDACDPRDATDSADASDVSDTVEQDDPSDSGQDISKITNYPQDGDVVLTLANATDFDEWVYFDFETQSQVFPENPIDSTLWDLAFRRFRVKLNGGYHGSGGVIASLVEGSAFADLNEVPVENWTSDRMDVEDDDDEFPEELLSLWYAYDPTNHTLNPLEHVYFVRTVEAQFIKLEFAGYYDQDGTSGNPSIRWVSLMAPADGIVEPDIEAPGDTSPESEEGSK